MTLFKKKADIPEIPEVPEPITYTFEKTNDKTSLPELPETASSSEEENRDAIKTAMDEGLNEPPVREIQKIPVPKEFQESIVEKNEELPPLPLNFKESSVPTPPSYIANERKISPPKNIENHIVKKDSEETIFVRIDKFNSAKKDVQQISKEIRNIEKVLEDLTATKMKEDEEVAEITKLTEEIKEKISKIETEVFNRV